jgi:hypothetical protein
MDLGAPLLVKGERVCRHGLHDKGQHSLARDTSTPEPGDTSNHVLRDKVTCIARDYTTRSPLTSTTLPNLLLFDVTSPNSSHYSDSRLSQATSCIFAAVNKICGTLFPLQVMAVSCSRPRILLPISTTNPSHLHSLNPFRPLSLHVIDESNEIPSCSQLCRGRMATYVAF